MSALFTHGKDQLLPHCRIPHSGYHLHIVRIIGDKRPSNWDCDYINSSAHVCIPPSIRHFRTRSQYLILLPSIWHHFALSQALQQPLILNFQMPASLRRFMHSSIRYDQHVPSLTIPRWAVTGCSHDTKTSRIAPQTHLPSYHRSKQ
jgi:hypothetical protein